MLLLLMEEQVPDQQSCCLDKRVACDYSLLQATAFG